MWLGVWYVYFGHGANLSMKDSLYFVTHLDVLFRPLRSNGVYS